MRNKRQYLLVDEHDDKQLFTTGEVADRLRVHKRTVQRWVSSGRLPATKVGPRVWRIRAEDLNAFLSNTESEDERNPKI